MILVKLMMMSNWPKYLYGIKRKDKFLEFKQKIILFLLVQVLSTKKEVK